MTEITFGPTTAARIWQRFLDALPPIPVIALTTLAGLLIPILLVRYPMAYTVVAVGGVLSLALVTTCPYLGLLIFVGLLYLRPEEYFSSLEGARMPLTVSLIALFGWMINAFLCRERFRFTVPSVSCFLGFILVAAVSTLISGSDNLNDELLDLVKLLVLFILVVHLVTTEKRLQIAVGWLVVFSAFLGARTIWQYMNGEALHQSDGSVRALATGIFGDPNDLSVALAMAVPLALGAVLGRSGSWTRIWNLAATAILVWTIFLTDSRGGMLALCAAFFMFFARRLGRVGIMIGAVAVLLAFAFGPGRLSEMNSDEESASARVDSWVEGLTMLFGSPLWGVGKGQYVENYFLTAHNSLVLCLAELGLGGTACWIGLFYFPLRDSRRLARHLAGHDAADAGDLPARLEPGPLKLAQSSQLSLPGHDTGRIGSLYPPAKAELPGPVSAVAPGAKGKLSPMLPSRALEVSLIVFMVGGFFLSRTYTPELYFYLALATVATHIDANKLGIELDGATRRDQRNIFALTLGTVPFMQILIHFWK